MDYLWVDAGLDKLGLKLDLSVSELPFVVRPAAGHEPLLTVNGILNAGKALFSAPLHGALSRKKKADDDDNRPTWAVDVGLYEGGSVVTDRTILTKLGGLNRSDWAKLVVDDSMLEVAKMWDETFVEGKFTHMILKSGKTFANDGKESIEGLPVQDVAKVMRWVFAAPGVAKREIVSVYVTSVDEQSIATWYLPVKGPSVAALAPQCVRGRLMVPCLDRGVFQADGSIGTFEHYATASLGGWFPAFVQNSGFGKKKFLEGSAEEAEHFLSLFEDARTPSSKFAQITRKDGTIL